MAAFTTKQNLFFSYFKELADDKINVASILELYFDRVENIMRKKEKMLVTSILFFSHDVLKRIISKVIESRDWLLAFSPFPMMFSKRLFLKYLKVGIV